MRGWIALGLLAALLVAPGCSAAEPVADESAAPSPPVASSSPPMTSPSAPVPSTSPGASASSGLSTLPAAQCLIGRWTLIRFVAVGGSTNDTYGTGEGGDTTLSFVGDRYTLAGAGSEPIAVTLAGRRGELTVDGSATGTYVAQDGTATFTQTGTDGDATLSGGGQQQTLPMEQVSQIIAPRGEAKVACTTDAMTLTLQAVRLELGRV